ncbi:hypothetical protein ETAA8_31500 [Anatilimnocola aggregata]|uniref:Uncharacterized protein n=2 Tax=Anatilimnocola aggregata TaxID=2528021 RepID=A0A517YCW5_9BACT|nr:hypothetical protein ETAA8_31500 [Anatilimnocola aggregata]
MSDSVSKFVDSVHEKLESLQGRMDSLRANIGTTWHSLQDELAETGQRGEESKPSVMKAYAALEQWRKDKLAEAKSTIAQWIENREAQKLATRAEKAEACAALAIQIAQASIDDAEHMILEAISARLDAEAVAHH